MKTLPAALLVLVGLSPALSAGQAPPRRPSRDLSLEQAVRLALAHNLRLAAEKINPQLAHTVIVEQQAVFDPTTYGEFGRAKSKEQSTTAILGERQQSAHGTLGVAKLFPPGTLIDVHAGGSREWSDTDPIFAAFNPAYRQEWGISITQPLLRGFGVRVNTAGIATARNERRIAQAQLRDVALATLADVEKAYWELVFAIRHRELLEASLRAASKIQSNVQERVKVGDMAERDPRVKQAAAGVAIRQEEIVAADQTIRDAEDALKVITDLAADPKVWNVGLHPTTEPPQTVPPLDPDKAADTALAKRPDYQQAKLAIQNQQILIDVHRNELRPRLDLTAGYGNTGLGTYWNRTDHELGTADYYAWTLGITFEYPLGNRAARSRYRRARLGHDQAKIHLRALERQIQLEVRNAVRAVATGVERIRAADASVGADQERLRAEQIRYEEANLGTLQDVLDAEKELAEARIRRLRALIDLNRALVDAERLQGTLLESLNVAWEEE